MSQYRFLQDHFINNVTYLAGTIASTLDAGGTLPVGWQPTGQVDPLDNAAVMAFWNAGPQLNGPIRQQWSTQAVGAPVTRWVPDPNAGPGNPYRQFVLNGLGAGLPMKQMLVGGAQP